MNGGVLFLFRFVLFSVLFFRHFDGRKPYSRLFPFPVISPGSSRNAGQGVGAQGGVEGLKGGI